MIKINLLPPELRRRAVRKINYLTLGIIPLVMIIILIPIYTSKVNQIKSLKKEIEEVNKEIDKFKHVKEQLKNVQNEIANLKTKIDFIKIKKERQGVWLRILDDLTSILPTDIWFTTLSVGDDGVLSMSGNTFFYSSVAEFIRVINRSKIFGEARLISSSKEYSAPGSGLPDRVTFSLTCKHLRSGEK